MWESWVRLLGWEYLLEKGIATHSSILAWRSPWTEEPMGYSPWGRKELDTTEWLTHTKASQLLRSLANCLTYSLVYYHFQMTKKLFLPSQWYEIWTKGEDPILHFRLQPTPGFSYKAQRRKEERASFLSKRENKLWAVIKLSCCYFKPSYKSVYLLDELIAVIHTVNLNREHLSLFNVLLDKEQKDQTQPSHEPAGRAQVREFKLADPCFACFPGVLTHGQVFYYP